MQELSKFNFEINAIPRGLKKYMSFNINKKLAFIDSFEYLSSSLESLVKNLDKYHLKYLSLEFDSGILDLQSGAKTAILIVKTEFSDLLSPGINVGYKFEGLWTIPDMLQH